MISIGIIGTNWISRAFLQATAATEAYECTAVYSRQLATAKAFAEKADVRANCYEDLALFLGDANLDVVYIASPNSLHFQQAREALLAGKHVIVEKPAVSTPQEFAVLKDLALENNCYFFEAARNIYEPNFLKVKTLLAKEEKILGANFTYMKYSSRYDAVLAGETPNIFSLDFSGGALMDLGVYLVYAAVEWFGKPLGQRYTCQKIVTGVDGIGVAVLSYPDFEVTLSTGKIVDSFLPSEIYLPTGTLQLDGVNSIQQIAKYTRDDKKSRLIAESGEEISMYSEAKAFAEMIQSRILPAENPKYLAILENSTIVHEVLYALRQDGEIYFAADQLS